MTLDWEWHTSDLTNPCMMAVRLTREGKLVAQGTRALWRGLVAGRTCERIHQEEIWDPNALPAIVHRSGDEINDQLVREARPPTDAVLNSRCDIEKEIEKHLTHYIERFGPWFQNHTHLVGCELPARIELPIQGRQVKFATHIDLLVREIQSGQLIIIDWKWREHTPTMAYLGRNLQFGLMYLMVADGYVKLPDPLMGWTQFHEFAECAWFDLATCKPYGTSRRNDSGGYEYQKGDHRPWKRIMKRWSFSPEREEWMMQQIGLRVAMAHHGLWTLTPDPLGCEFCECNQFCPSYHKDGFISNSGGNDV